MIRSRSDPLPLCIPLRQLLTIYPRPESVLAYYDYGEAVGASSRHHYTDRSSWHIICIRPRQLCGLFSIPFTLNRSEFLGLSNGRNFYLPYAVFHRTRSRHTISIDMPNSHLVPTRVLSQRIMLPLFAIISR